MGSWWPDAGQEILDFLNTYWPVIAALGTAILVVVRVVLRKTAGKAVEKRRELKSVMERKSSADEAVRLCHDAHESLSGVIRKLSAEYATATPERRDALSHEWTAAVSVYRRAVDTVRSTATRAMGAEPLERYSKEILAVCERETPADAKSPFQVPSANPWKFE